MKSYLQESDKENQTSVSNSIETLNEVTFESDESVLSNQSTLSTLDYEPISDPFEKLKNTRLKSPNRLIIAQLNINSLRNKFDSLVRMLHNNLDILLISETKTDSSFPGKSAESVVNNLEQSSTILFKWLNNNYMKVNTGKSHLLLSGNSRATATIDNSYIESEDEQVLLGITTDSNLTFENHVRNICKKASQKLNALARIAPYMNIQKRTTVMKSFVTSQFSYCPLIWMFHSRRLNNKINSIHERALRIAYQDNTSAFQELLNKDNSVSIHHGNLQVLATEMFKIHRGLSPEILRETFVSKTSSYNLRRNAAFEKRKVHSVYHGTESLSFLGPKIWDLVPVELKQSETLYSFKLKIKNWVLFNVHAEYVKLTYNK